MLLSVRQVYKSFPTEEGPLQVLRGVDLDLDAGEKLALTGESGSGKSTLLYLAAGLDVPDKGKIFVDGTAVSSLNDEGRALLRRNQVGVVFQQFNLVPSLNVLNNLRLHARLAGREDKNWVEQLAARLGLEEYLSRYPEQLSGGQQQRVAIGRTLAARPRLVLADEPTGNLDEETGDAVIDLMQELVAETGSALLMVTHSSRLAKRMDKALHLKAGQLS